MIGLATMLSIMFANQEPEPLRCRYVHFNIAGADPPSEPLVEAIVRAVRSANTKISIKDFTDKNVLLNRGGQVYEIDYEKGDVFVEMTNGSGNWNIVVSHAEVLRITSADTLAMSNPCDAKGVCKFSGQSSDADNLDEPLRNAVMAVNQICQTRGHEQGLTAPKRRLARADLERIGEQLMEVASALEEAHRDFHIDRYYVEGIREDLTELSSTAAILDDDIQDLSRMSVAVDRLDDLANKRRPHLTRSQRAGAIAGGALGLALGTVGASLLAINGRCVGSLGDPVESRSTCPRIYMTNLAGAIFVGAGMVSIGTSGILVTAWLTNPKWNSPSFSAGLNLRLQF